MDSWKAGAPSSQFGPSFPIAVWLVRETALTFWCYNCLYLSVSLLKVVKAAVPVTSFDFFGVLFPQGEWPQQVLSGGEWLS